MTLGTVKPEPDMMTVREVCDELGVNEETPRRWIRSGRVPAEMIGRIWFFRRSDIDKLRAKTA